MYNSYWESLTSPAPAQLGEYSPYFKKMVLTSFEDYITRNPQIDRITVEGSILDIHYRQRVSRNQYRLDASIVAEQFSHTKMRHMNNGDVLVRCIYGELVRVEAIAHQGQIRLQEL